MKSEPRRKLHVLKVAVMAAMALGLACAALVPLPHFWQTHLVQGFLDFSHFVVAALLCWFLWARLGHRTWPAFLAVVAAAALCELLQSLTGRCPAMADFLRGALGALAMAICLEARGPVGQPLRAIGAAVIVAAISAWPVGEFLALASDVFARLGSGPL